MSGSTVDRLADRVPRGLLGMLALVLIVETALAGARVDLTSPLAESWRFAAEAARTKAVGADVLCLGDSLVKYGVLPRVIEAKTGRKAYGLACSGGTTRSAFFLLRQALGAGARPRAVVVDFDALMSGGESPNLDRNYAELATARDCLDLAWFDLRDRQFSGNVLASVVLPSWRFRFMVRVKVLAALAGRGLTERASVESHQKIWAREFGAQPTEPGRLRHPQEATLIHWLSPEHWESSPALEAYVDRFLDLAGSHGVAVYWLLPPLAPEVHSLRAARGSDEAYGRFVRSVAARHSNVVVLDARGSGYGDSVHADHLHLDRRGAAVLSADVASILLDPPAPRGIGAVAWVALPAYSGRMVDDAPPPALARSRPEADRRDPGVLR